MAQKQEPVTLGARGRDYRPVLCQNKYTLRRHFKKKLKQQWSEEETKCLLALWSSTEIQNKLEGAVRTKPIFEKIKLEMVNALVMIEVQTN